MGTVLGVALAVGIVHYQTLDRSLMPWIITSQTIPILAIAPMIIVVLNAVGISGLLPKANDLDVSLVLPHCGRNDQGAAFHRKSCIST
jgi:ABC-type proline/glycine betaine transport system permease subunit